jgi:hypothetical protein
MVEFPFIKGVGRVGASREDLSKILDSATKSTKKSKQINF